MKKWLFLACSAALPLFAVPFEPQMDLEQYALMGRFFQYNQSADLGEPGKKAPGYWIEGWRIAKSSPLRKDAVLPVTFKEADGNYCIMVPGDPNLREYNLNVTSPVAGMRFPKEGEVVCSFRMKIAPDVDGKLNPPVPVILDFRSINIGKQYGSVKDRFPVLVSKSYIPTQEWKTYSFRTKVPAGDYPYSIAFRLFSNSADHRFNTLLFDDFKLDYADDKSAPLEEAQIVHDDPNHIYYEASKIEPKIRALLRSEEDREKLELVCRTRYDHQIVKRLPVTLKKAGHKTADGRNLYTGTVSFPMPRFGSYELLPLRGKDVMPCDIADFQMIRRPNTDLSPLQRKLGAHYPTAYSHFQGSWDNKTVPSRYRSSTEDVMSVLQNSGFGQVLLWFHFGALMRESPEKADTIHYRPTVEMMKKYNLTGIGNIGHGFLNQTGYRKKGNREFASLPMWLMDKKYKVRSSQIPHLRQWEIMTAALLKDFGDQFHHWELMIEPQWCTTAEEYMPILKQTYRQVRAAGPEHKMIAVDATSDQGKNLTDWVQKLHNLGVEDYCDYVSFNPYGSGVDFMNGVRFRNTDLVNRIRKIVKPGTKLWQVELFYIPHSKRFQAPTNQSYFAGADGQRHILLGLKNQLFGITCFDYVSFFRGPYAASELVSAMSALSYYLRDKEKTEVPETKNQFVRQMIFRGKDDNNCSGAFWVLQTLPAKLTLPKLPASVKFYDTYGNQLKADKVMDVGLDPVFFTGTYKDLKTMLKTAAWNLGASVKLYRRACGNESFYEAENISGQKDSIAIFPEGREDGIRFNFTDTDLIRFCETGKAIGQFNTSQNKKFVKVIDVPASPVYTLPAESELKLKTKNGVSFTLAAGENGSLIVTAEIPDTDIVCGKKIFDGDAVELFIDRTPFRHIGAEKIRNTQTDLRVKQFAFDPNGRIFSKNLVTMVQEPGGTTVKITKNEKSWKCVVTLPNDEVRPVEGIVLGFNLELCRNDGGKSLEKDVFSGKESYMKRQHYTLIRLPGNLTGNIKLDKTASGRFTFPEEPKWGPKFRRGIFSSRVVGGMLPAGRYLLRFTGRGRKIIIFKVDISGAAKQQELARTFLPQEDSWTCYTLPYEVKKDQRWARAGFQFLAPRPDTDAWGEIKDVELIRQDGTAPLEDESSSGAVFRIDLQVLKDSCGLKADGGSKDLSISKATWKKDKADCRLQTVGNSGKKWKEGWVRFIPAEDCNVRVELMSNSTKDYVAFDHIRIEGASVKNGSFEQLDAKGNAQGWYALGKYTLKKTDAADGENCVEVFHNGRAMQNIKCKKGQPVKITFMVRDVKR